MADSKISALTAALALADTDELVLASAGVSKKITGANLRAGYGTSLPASPVNGQEYILVDSLTNPTYQWSFRYNAGSTSPYKWEFVGGAPVTAYGGALQSTNSVYPSFIDLSTASPRFTVPRAGDYSCSYTGSCDSDTVGGNPMATIGFGPAGGASTVKDPDLVYARPPNPGWKIVLCRTGVLLAGVPAGQQIRMLLCSFAVASISSLERASMTVQPVRVS